MPTNTTGTSSSLSGFIATLVPVAIVAAIFFILFLIFRPKFARVYRPRQFLETLRPDERSNELPEGKFNWLKPFRTIPDEYVLNHQSLDGYLYLRFLKMVTIICFVGCCITFPVLFPINATGNVGQTQLDLLNFGNIGKDQKNRYYAHALVGWVFFSFILWMITRETIYFINLRHAYLLSPFNSARISSRTVLFTDVPVDYLSISKLQALFGESFLGAWIQTDCSELEKVVENRDKAAAKLEGAEIKLSKVANNKRLKWEKKNEKKKPVAAPADVDAEAAQPVQSEWLEKKDRPTHRLGKIPLIGKKVDTIDWARTELRTLEPQIQTSQDEHRKGKGKILPALFVEFRTQQAAQLAYRRMSPKKSPKMNPRAIGVKPDEVVWKNLKITKTQRMLRKFGTRTFLTLMIIFWAIPVAVVGAISNINYLTSKVHFLSFINDIPSVILGVVTGLLPSVMLAVLMSLVPVVCRLMVKLGGAVTLAQVELGCQSWYMAFQVIQVFVITTFSSAASAVVTQIIDDPSSATTLLAENLPKASNFYISYFILQGLGIATGDLLNIGALAMLTVVGKFLDKSPRKMFKRYITLSGLGWGSLYPKFGNLAIIAITYSIISPLVLGFATIGFALVYFATRYNSIFILTNSVDTKGAAYAKVLQQLMTGVYISEVCLIGLFAINTAPGPIVLMAVFLGFTIVYHILMNHALKPLVEYLPESYEGEHQLAMFNTSGNKSYDSSKDSNPPSFLAPAGDSEKPKLSTRKAGILAKIFNPQRFKSHATMQTLVPMYQPPLYEELVVQLAYFAPSITAQKPRLWIVRDEMGISQKEVKDSLEVVQITDELARFDEKGKVVWDREAGLEAAPIYEKRIDY